MPDDDRTATPDLSPTTEHEDVPSAVSADPVANGPVDPVLKRIIELQQSEPGHRPPPDPAVISPSSMLDQVFSAINPGSSDAPSDLLAHLRLMDQRLEELSPSPSQTLKDQRRVSWLDRAKERSQVPMAGQVQDVRIGQITTVGFSNFRLTIKEDEFRGIVQSVAAFGMLHPLTVVRAKYDPDKLILISGEQRYRAALELHLEMVPVVIRAVENEAECYLVNLVENLCRSTPGTYELAARCELMIHRFTMTRTELARLLNFSVSHISGLISYLSIPAPNFLEDWKQRHPLATLPRIARLAKEYDPVETWARWRAAYDRNEGKLLTEPVFTGEAEEEDVTGLAPYKRPTKAAIMRLRDTVARQRNLPTDPEGVLALALGLLDYCRGVTSKIPSVFFAPPLRKQGQARRRKEG